MSRLPLRADLLGVLRSDSTAIVEDTGEASKQSGELPKRLTLAGGGLFMTLSNWGLLPQARRPPAPGCM